MTRTHVTLALATLAALGLAATTPHAARAQNPTDTIAYAVTQGTGIDQYYGGTLGMDFNVASPIEVTQLGAFAPYDSGTGPYTFTGDKTVSIYDRTATATPLVTVVFAGGAAYTQTGGSVFQKLGTPLLLPAGFQGTVVASGYGTDGFYNTFAPTPNSTTTENSGGGAVQFVGNSEYGATGSEYPTHIEDGPEDRYDAGTFSFTAAPEPSQFAALGLGLLGLAGLALKARRSLSAGAKRTA